MSESKRIRASELFVLLKPSLSKQLSSENAEIQVIAQLMLELERAGMAKPAFADPAWVFVDEEIPKTSEELVALIKSANSINMLKRTQQESDELRAMTEVMEDLSRGYSNHVPALINPPRKP